MAALRKASRADAAGVHHTHTALRDDLRAAPISGGANLLYREFGKGELFHCAGLDVRPQVFCPIVEIRSLRCDIATLRPGTALLGAGQR